MALDDQEHVNVRILLGGSPRYRANYSDGPQILSQLFPELEGEPLGKEELFSRRITTWYQLKNGFFPFGGQ